MEENQRWCCYEHSSAAQPPGRLPHDSLQTEQGEKKLRARKAQLRHIATARASVTGLCRDAHVAVKVRPTQPQPTNQSLHTTYHGCCGRLLATRLYQRLNGSSCVCGITLLDNLLKIPFMVAAGALQRELDLINLGGLPPPARMLADSRRPGSSADFSLPEAGFMRLLLCRTC